MTTLGGGGCNERKEGRVYNLYNFLKYCAKVHNSAGHMTHINPSEYAQTTGSSH